MTIIFMKCRHQYYIYLTNPLGLRHGCPIGRSASKAEMEAIADLAGVQSARLPGTLGLAEEYGAAVAEAVLPFIGGLST